MMGDRQWPDPLGWEALTQAEAEQDARARDWHWRYWRDRATAAESHASELRQALAVAERERDQARDALRQILTRCEDGNAAWSRLDVAALARAALAEEAQT